MRSPVQKVTVAQIDVAGQQVSAVGISARHHQRGNAHHIGRQSCRHQFLDCFGGRNQNLAAKCPHFFADES